MRRRWSGRRPVWRRSPTPNARTTAGARTRHREPGKPRSKTRGPRDASARRRSSERNRGPGGTGDSTRKEHQMDITVRSEAFGVEDRSWLGSAHGTEATRTITLDVSAFTAGTHYPN